MFFAALKVCCAMGVNRSALAVAAYLVDKVSCRDFFFGHLMGDVKIQMNLIDVVRLLKKKRGHVFTNKVY